MVRNYNRKEVKRKWNKDDMMNAIEEVQMTVSRALEHIAVPRRTLQYWMISKYFL